MAAVTTLNLDGVIYTVEPDTAPVGTDGVPQVVWLRSGKSGQKFYLGLANARKLGLQLIAAAEEAAKPSTPLAITASTKAKLLEAGEALLKVIREI